MWNWDLIVSLCLSKRVNFLSNFWKEKHFLETLWNADVCTGWDHFQAIKWGASSAPMIFNLFPLNWITLALEFPSSRSFERESLEKNLDKQIFSSKAFKKYFSTSSSGLLFYFQQLLEAKATVEWISETYCERFLGTVAFMNDFRSIGVMNLQAHNKCKWVFWEYEVFGASGKMSKFIFERNLAQVEKRCSASWRLGGTLQSGERCTIWLLQNGNTWRSKHKAYTFAFHKHYRVL